MSDGDLLATWRWRAISVLGVFLLAASARLGWEVGAWFWRLLAIHAS